MHPLAARASVPSPNAAALEGSGLGYGRNRSSIRATLITVSSMSSASTTIPARSASSPIGTCVLAEGPREGRCSCLNVAAADGSPSAEFSSRRRDAPRSRGRRRRSSGRSGLPGASQVDRLDEVALVGVEGALEAPVESDHVEIQQAVVVAERVVDVHSGVVHDAEHVAALGLSDLGVVDRESSEGVVREAFGFESGQDGLGQEGSGWSEVDRSDVGDEDREQG